MKDYSAKSDERYSTLDANLVGNDHLFRYRHVASRIGMSHEHLFGADIFCGSGYGSALVARETGATLLAIDGAQESIAIAREKYTAPNILWAAKLYPFELPVACFDFVMSMESLEHVKDFSGFFWSLARSLKPGGRLFVSSPNENVMPYSGYKWHYRHFRSDDVRDLAKQNGLQEVFAVSTSCQLLEGGRARLLYPHQIHNDQPLDLESGDTLFFEFCKA